MSQSKFMHCVRDIEHTVRPSFFGFTAMLPLIAAGTIDPEPASATIAALLLIAVNFHLFGYLHNDLIDLPVDRTQPQRARDPLVTGRLPVPLAWVIAATQIPISFGIVWMIGGSTYAHGALFIGYLATMMYNLYGKRCSVPMATDALQGVAWFGLASFGAALAGGFSTFTFVIALFGFAFIFLINGVHGGLRDLANDQACGRITTAIYFGACEVSVGHMQYSPGLPRFAAFAFSLTVLPTALCLVTNRFAYTPELLAVVIALWSAINVLSAWHLWQVIKPQQTDRRRWIYAHQIPLLAPPLIAFVPMLGWTLRFVIIGTWAAVLLLFSEPVNNVVTSLWRSATAPLRREA